MSPRLSICIPTYNRAVFLDEALASICRQGGLDDVEIVISDNASGDDTRQVVERWQQRFAGIRYFRWSENQGADKNFLKVIELATGDYCWLLGSDDRLADGSIAALMPYLSGNDILLLSYQLMSFDMHRLLASRQPLSAEPGTRFRIVTPNDLRDYLSRVREMSGLFAFISTVVVRHAAWMTTPDRAEFIGSAWIHVTKLLDLFRNGAQLQYVGLPLVLNRAGNDSFLAEVGYARRTMIDLDYVRICKRLFENQPEMRAHLLARLENWFFTWHAVLGIKWAVARSDGAKGLALVEPALFSAFEAHHQHTLKHAAWRWAPLWLLGGLRRIDRWRRGLPLGAFAA